MRHAERVRVRQCYRTLHASQPRCLCSRSQPRRRAAIRCRLRIRLQPASQRSGHAATIRRCRRTPSFVAATPQTRHAAAATRVVDLPPRHVYSRQPPRVFRVPQSLIVTASTMFARRIAASAFQHNRLPVRPKISPFLPAFQSRTRRQLRLLARTADR